MTAEPDAGGQPPGRSVLRSGARAVLLVVMVGIGSIAVALLTAVRGYGRTRRGTIALQALCRMTLCGLGVRVVSLGAVRSGPSLVVANRLSWLDVLVLAAASPMVPLADTQVRQSSPLAPIAARVGTVFAGSTSSRELSGAIERVTATLRGGHRVLVFPGGVEASGCSREPFHRAVFQAAVDAATVISPVALSYRGPSAGSARIDDGMVGSLWRTLRGGPLTVRVQWLPVIPAVAGSGHRSAHRAAAAARAEWAIDRALGAQPSRPRAGRPPMPSQGPSERPVGVPSSGRLGIQLVA